MNIIMHTLPPAKIPDKLQTQKGVHSPNEHIEDDSNKLKYRAKLTVIHLQLHDTEKGGYNQR